MGTEIFSINIYSFISLCSISGEATNSDRKAAEKCVPEFQELITSEGFIAQQVFNCDETSLRTYITAEEKSVPGLKP